MSVWDIVSFVFLVFNILVEEIEKIKYYELVNYLYLEDDRYCVLRKIRVGDKGVGMLGWGGIRLEYVLWR